MVLNFCGTNSNWQSLDWTTKSNGTGLLIETDIANSNGRMLIPTEVADKQRRLVEVDVNFIEEITVSHARRE